MICFGGLIELTQNPEPRIRTESHNCKCMAHDRQEDSRNENTCI